MLLPFTAKWGAVVQTHTHVHFVHAHAYAYTPAYVCAHAHADAHRHTQVKLDAQGTPISALYDPDGTHVATVSAATEHSGRLFLGNLGGDFISFVDLNSTTE